jgi:hypothetical protein
VIILTSVCTVIDALVLLAWLLSMLTGVLSWVLYRRRQRRMAEKVIDAMSRHPAGSAVSFAFRARPCRHLLHVSSLDPLDMEHVEFDHVRRCEVARQLTERDVA